MRPVASSPHNDNDDKRANKRARQAASAITSYPPLCGSMMTKKQGRGGENGKEEKDQHKQTINGRNESKKIKSREELN